MAAKGIWVSDRQFMRFAEPNMKLSDQIATRDRSIDYLGFGLLLPNPDPILKAKGQDIRVYRDLRSDAHLGGCVRRRKSAVKALDWGLDRGQAKSRVAKNVEAIFKDLDLDRIIGELMEAPLYGYQPMEITWSNVGGLVVPTDLQGKPPEWFVYGIDNVLRFRTKVRPIEGEDLPDRKFIVARQDATYANPYGFPDLSMCFWPIVFKKGGVKFWVNFAEKYGTPWAIGKLPRGTPQSDIDALADQLEGMIQDAVAVIPDDGAIELLEPTGKAAITDLYSSLVMYCRSEVSIALTGTNQTVEANSNKASASAGLEVADDLRDGDAEIVAQAINQLIRWTCEINWGGGERPTWSMWDQEAQDVMQANRDKTVTDAGARLTNKYWMRAYDFQEGDLGPEGAPASALPVTTAQPAGGVAFAEGVPADPISAETDQLSTAADPSWQAILGTIQTEIDKAQDLSALQTRLTEIYGGLASTDLVNVMAAAFALAELKGMAEAGQ